MKNIGNNRRKATVAAKMKWPSWRQQKINIASAQWQAKYRLAAGGSENGNGIIAYRKLAANRAMKAAA